MKRSELWRAYLRSRLRGGVIWASTIAVLCVICALYGLPPGPVGYAVVLMSAVWLGFAVWDLRRYCKDVRELEALERQDALQLDQLPPAQDLRRALCWRVLGRVERRREKQARAASAAAVATAQYYTIWSHQAKTPLTAMGLLLREDAVDRSLFAQELRKAEQYVDMALQYQRLQASSNDLVLRESALAPLVKQAVRETSALFIGKKIAIKLGALDGQVLTDRKWLLFALEQLLTNAVKYTIEGSVQVWFTAGVLSIRDTGIGISQADLPRIFEWGYTGEAGREATRATGIGLSLCKRAMDMLGHTITIESEEGRGTTVRLGLSRERFDIE